MRKFQFLAPFFILALCFTATAYSAAVTDLFLGSKVQHSYRAYPLEVDKVTASMIAAENKVDVLITFEALLKDGRATPVTATFLQNIPVIETVAVNSKNYLILSLSPIEAQYMLLMQRQTYKVILRPEGDNAIFQIEVVK